MTKKCWICEKEDAATGEHAIMKAAYERIFGKLENGKEAFLSYIDGKKNIPIRSFKNNRLKFNKSICKICNGVMTQPYDDEFIKFVEKIIKSKNLILSRGRVSLSSFDKTNLGLYFIKIFGCLIEGLDWKMIESDHELMRRSIVQKKILTNNIYLSAHRDLEMLAAVDTKTVSHYPVFQENRIAWNIDFDWISLLICYPAPMQEKYGTQWNVRDNLASLKVGKII